MIKKKEFIKLVAEKAGLTHKDVEAVINGYHEAVVESLEKKEEIGFMGFGKYSVKFCDARQRSIPSSDKMVTIPAHYVPDFKFSNVVKDTVKAANPVEVPKKAKKKAGKE